LLDFFESVRSGIGELGCGAGSPLNSIKEHEGEIDIEKKQPSAAEYIVGDVKSPLVASVLCGTGIGTGAEEAFTIPSSSAEPHESSETESRWVPIVSANASGEIPAVPFISASVSAPISSEGASAPAEDAQCIQLEGDNSSVV
jgi:hypothetical protein